jgi:hypothetical protein
MSSRNRLRQSFNLLHGRVVSPTTCRGPLPLQDQDGALDDRMAAEYLKLAAKPHRPRIIKKTRPLNQRRHPYP